MRLSPIAIFVTSLAGSLLLLSCGEDAPTTGEVAATDSTVLICDTRLGSTSITVTGIETPSSEKIRVIPTLRPTKPRDIVKTSKQTVAVASE